jgi:hypothetical protein
VKDTLDDGYCTLFLLLCTLCRECRLPTDPPSMSVPNTFLAKAGRPSATRWPSILSRPVIIRGSDQTTVAYHRDAATLCMPPSFRRCCPVATARSHLKASPGPARRRRRPPILSSAFRPLCGNGCASWTPSGAEPGECCTWTDKSSPAMATWAGRRGHGTSGREIAAVSPLGGTGVHATHSPPDPPGDVTVGAAPCAYQTGQSQCSTHCCAVDPYLQNPGGIARSGHTTEGNVQPAPGEPEMPCGALLCYSLSVSGA